MDKRVLLDQLKEARATDNKDLFFEVMGRIQGEGLDDPELMIEANDILLDVLEEWGWLDRMIEHARGLINENPNDSQTKTELGCYYFKKGELNKAEILLASALEVQDNPMAQHYLDIVRERRLEAEREINRGDE